jgi:uncharacterized iron-regulated membrane protein
MSGLNAAWSGEHVIHAVVEAKPDFYAVAESLDKTVVPFNVGTSQVSRVYVDSVTGKLLVAMDSSRRAYAWVYYALHTFNFPLLLVHTSTRNVVVLLLLSIGLTFSCTGAVLGFQRLRRTFAR